MSSRAAASRVKVSLTELHSRINEKSQAISDTRSCALRDSGTRVFYINKLFIRVQKYYGELEKGDLRASEILNRTERIEQGSVGLNIRLGYRALRSIHF